MVVCFVCTRILAKRSLKARLLWLCLFTTGRVRILYLRSRFHCPWKHPTNLWSCFTLILSVAEISLAHVSVSLDHICFSFCTFHHLEVLFYRSRYVRDTILAYFPTSDQAHCCPLRSLPCRSFWLGLFIPCMRRAGRRYSLS